MSAFASREIGECLVSNLFSFGFEDQISQPQIKGLDEKPGPKEPEAIPPG